CATGDYYGSSAYW
nr:immunoglobulin heavy chain junction region [Mus musculus]